MLHIIQQLLQLIIQALIGPIGTNIEFEIPSGYFSQKVKVQATVRSNSTTASDYNTSTYWTNRSKH